MHDLPEDLKRRLQQHGQPHVIARCEGLDPVKRLALLDQLRALDLELLHRLYQQKDQTFALPARERIQPAPITRLTAAHARERTLGEEALPRGDVAVLMVAGGQGSRLGFEHPKGMFAIGPVTRKSLFQIHVEKTLALRKRYGKPLPFLVMTSHATHE